MVWRKQCQEIANSGPVFLTVYATVVVGILLSSFYVLSAIYSSGGSSGASSWSLPPASSKHPHSLHLCIHICTATGNMAYTGKIGLFEFGVCTSIMQNLGKARAEHLLTKKKDDIEIVETSSRIKL
ncbi:unnamed protein product [Thlaspi arvense]|uniref:Uncharacterized protein n=1 Tax=Thlaspi arvense TaxID=13288 RepID=A0AAU9RK30_THLAR|nr:unnamed protein product [Thlaspi arvense]